MRVKRVADLTGPELYVAVLMYRATGEVAKALAAVVVPLAAEADVLGCLLARYPESRVAEYRAVAGELCARLYREAVARQTEE